MRMSFFFICLFYCQFTTAQQNKDTSFKSYNQSIPGSSLFIKMAPIPAGSFVMGDNQSATANEKPQRKINISAFWMGAYEITRDEYDLFYKDESTSENADVDAVTRPTAQYIDLTWNMGKEGGYPANSMSQFNALMFCRWLYKKSGIFYRLPTEAEWEYACRAGGNGSYYFSEDKLQLKNYAWFAGSSDLKYHRVGQKIPNSWGLYDMLGNLCEWTLDHYSEDYYSRLTDEVRDPMAEISSSKFPHSLRGGSYLDDAADLKITKRWASDPSWNKRDPQIPKSKWWLTDAAHVGFRIVRPFEQPAREEADAFYKNYLGK